MNLQHLPQHLAIIMDGNGRWAQGRNKPRGYGHLKGTRIAKKIIRECSGLGIKYLTLYAFSTENWYRPQQEVSLLMSILNRYLLKETANLIKENICVNVIGDPKGLPIDVQIMLNKTIEKTAKCTGMKLIFALNYGSRQEITAGIRKIALQVKSGNIQPEDIDESVLSAVLSSAPNPDPDFIIRTSGEQRISNFLLWQSAYSEFYFCDTLWPDFTSDHLKLALLEFEKRERRFGRVNSKVTANEHSLN